MTQKKQQDKIQEIMGLVNEMHMHSFKAGAHSCKFSELREMEKYANDADRLAELIKSKLRELVREPLDAHEVGCLVETAAYLSTEHQRRADFINGIRYAERAHGITSESGEV